MGVSRKMLRDEAKKIYKERVKSIPKRNRKPFNDFYKQYVKTKQVEQQVKDLPSEIEDFDFDNLVNEIDDSLVMEEADVS